MRHTRLFLLSLLLISSLSALAYDFSATVGDQRIYFEITNKAKKTACVTFNGSVSGRKTSDLKGTIEIPPKIKHNNVVYTINAIGPKAFADAKNLEGIVIPSGIETIGDFAFEGCTSLRKVVFPGNVVKLGQGIFFKCTSISSVTIGSDWKSIDLTMFRWSNNLTSITIPAKVEKVQGMKKLKCLETISVDPNNENFSSTDGILYSKNGKTLYGCPRAYDSVIRVKAGTEIIEPGALIDCTEVTMIDFPASLRSVSFRETERMKELKTIVMRPVNPIITAYKGKKGFFMFLLSDPKTEIVVPNQSKSKYIDLLPTEPGQYSDKVGSIPYEISEKELPTKKNIKGVKNFDKY